MVAIEVKRDCVLCEVRSGTMETVPIIEKLGSLYVNPLAQELFFF